MDYYTVAYIDLTFTALETNESIIFLDYFLKTKTIIDRGLYYFVYYAYDNNCV